MQYNPQPSLIRAMKTASGTQPSTKEKPPPFGEGISGMNGKQSVLLQTEGVMPRVRDEIAEFIFAESIRIINFLVAVVLVHNDARIVTCILEHLNGVAFRLDILVGVLEYALPIVHSVHIAWLVKQLRGERAYRKIPRCS